MLIARSKIEFAEFSDLESKREAWEGLAARSGNVFATWEWNDTWWRHFGGAGRPAFLECREADGRLFAILPLYETRIGPFRALRLLGHGPGDVLGPIAAPADRAAAGRALRESLSRPQAPRLMLGERLPGGLLSPPSAGKIVHREANPRLDIDGLAWDAYVKTWSRNLREKLRRSTRKLERSHDVAYRLCDDGDRLDADFDELMRLHRARWTTSNFTREPVTAFHRELVATMMDRGWLRLWLMEIDGKPVAAWYGFRFEGVESFYQSGRDPRFDRYSIGFLMLVHTIKAAFDDGLDSYAFLRGDEPYKDRFATADDGLETHVFGRGGVASAMVGLGSAALRSQYARRLVTESMR